MSILKEHEELTKETSRICKETGRPYWQVEEEVFGAFWSANPAWAPEAVGNRKANGYRVNSDNEFEDQ